MIDITFQDALARIETLEAEKETLEFEKAHLLKVIKERKLAGYVVLDFVGNPVFRNEQNEVFKGLYKPVYYISDEYDAAGFLITPEVKIET